jgi:hypothetical protein
MNGKDCVVSAIEKMENAISEMKSAGTLDGDPLLDDAAKACETLKTLKNKPTLRTRDGTNLAYPVMEAAQNMEEVLEDSEGEDDLDELRMNMEEFTNSVNALVGALKERTLVMT